MDAVGTNGPTAYPRPLTESVNAGSPCNMEGLVTRREMVRSRKHLIIFVTMNNHHESSPQ